MKREYDDVLSEYGIAAYDEGLSNTKTAMTEREKFAKWLNTLDKQTLVTMAAKQARTIEELQAATKAAVPQWIPVSERLPDEGTYFCLGHNGTPFVCLLRNKKYEGCVWLRNTGTRRVDGITHWMPLPSATEGQQ